EGAADFGGEGEFGEDLLHGAVEKSVGGGEEAHEEEIGSIFAEVKRGRELFAEVGASERGLDEFGRFGAGHDDESDDGGPAAEFAVAEESDGLANVVNFNAQSKGGRIQKAEQAVGKRRILAEEFFNGGVIELGCAGCLKKAETNGL